MCCRCNKKNHAKSLDTYLNTVLSNTRDSNIQSYIKDLIIDTKQIIEATNDYSAFNRWGKHYLPSLMNAHLNQECNNLVQERDELLFEGDFEP